MPQCFSPVPFGSSIPSLQRFSSLVLVLSVQFYNLFPLAFQPFPWLNCVIEIRKPVILPPSLKPAFVALVIWMFFFLFANSFATIKQLQRSKSWNRIKQLKILEIFFNCHCHLRVKTFCCVKIFASRMKKKAAEIWKKWRKKISEWMKQVAFFENCFVTLFRIKFTGFFFAFGMKINRV